MAVISLETGAGKMDLRVGIALVLMQERYGQKLTLQKYLRRFI